MIRRLAVVFWWVGAAFRLAAALGLVGGLLLGGRERWGIAAGCLVGFGLFWLCSWTAAYILGGSFLKPPTVQ